MAEQLRGPFEKFVDWWLCAAVMHKSITAAHCRQSTNLSNGPRIRNRQGTPGNLKPRSKIMGRKTTMINKYTTFSRVCRDLWYVNILDRFVKLAFFPRYNVQKFSTSSYE